ncbi:hypothetical protein [Colwellia sp. 20A7]|uniref:hypothetical protein n=1 Tax=Colwellia sp. 20A7 TaxID=2689569 RepID=UPI0013595CAA|nr:hypothetical protein [Colwellia sp. 20A7]
MNINKNKSLLVLTLIASLNLAACADNHAENAGENVDEVISDTGNAIEDACENVKDEMGTKDKNC